MSRSFNLSELLLLYMYTWDNLVNFPGTLGEINEITFGRPTAQCTWHIGGFKMCWSHLFTFQNMEPCKCDGELAPQGHLWNHGTPFVFYGVTKREPGVFGGDLLPVSSVCWPGATFPMGLWQDAWTFVSPRKAFLRLQSNALWIPKMFIYRAIVGIGRVLRVPLSLTWFFGQRQQLRLREAVTGLGHKRWWQVLGLDLRSLNSKSSVLVIYTISSCVTYVHSDSLNW